MIVCVDGTGAYSEQQYQKDMANSFCNQIVKQKGFGKAAYFEGPGGAGLSTRGTANQALKAIREFYQADPRIYRTSPLYLAGYSRGGACVLQIAKWLNEGNFPFKVKGLFLFDPVNRDLNLNMDGRGTPPNVKNVFVIFRDKKIEEVNTVSDRDIYARKWMGTCCWEPQDSRATRIGLSEIITGASHGAVGGAGWVEREADRIGEAVAALLMSRSLKSEGLNITLRSLTFSNKPNNPILNLPKSGYTVTFKR